MSDDEKIKLYKKTYEELRDYTCSYKTYSSSSNWLCFAITLEVILIITTYFSMYNCFTFSLFIIIFFILVIVIIKNKKITKKADQIFASHYMEFCWELENYLREYNIENVQGQKIKAIEDLRNYILFGYRDKTIINAKRVTILFTILGFLFTTSIFSNDKLQILNIFELDNVCAIFVLLCILCFLAMICFSIAELSGVFDLLGETKNEVLRNIDKYIANLEEEERIQNRKKQKLLIERKTITSDKKIINSKMTISYKNIEDKEKAQSPKNE